MDKNWIEGVAEQGDEALVIKAEWRKSGGCSQGVRSCPGISRLMAKRPTLQGVEREVSRGRSSRQRDEGPSG